MKGPCSECRYFVPQFSETSKTGECWVDKANRKPTKSDSTCHRQAAGGPTINMMGNLLR